MEKFAPLQQIIEIYTISRETVRGILRKYRIDYYKDDDNLYINFKEFHHVYTTKYNPCLFIVEDKPREERKFIIESSINRTFFNIFREPVNYKQKKLWSVAIAYAR